jgi:hypothetical protein
MTFATVLFFCIGGVAGCAVLVFLVETAVAFWLHDGERETLPVSPRPMLVERTAQPFPSDRAA